MTHFTFKDILIDSEITDVKELLSLNGLTYEQSVTKTIGLYDKNKLVATGSLDHNVIKMIAVHPDYMSLNLSSKILSYLLFEIEEKNINHYFLFTKLINEEIFNNFSFNQVIKTDSIVLYENKENKIDTVLKTLKNKLPKKNGSRGAIVMNLNPMTLGHLFLIEHAAKKMDDLIIFLVETDESIIDYKTRYSILTKSITHLKNIHVLNSTVYIISRATFPTYFLKNEEHSAIYTELDISIFKKYFMPIFEIDYRFVADEPLDKLTDTYNKTMKHILGENLIMIDRKKHGNKVISASYVRSLAKEKRYDEIKEVVPNETYKFLISKKGRLLFND